MNIGYSIWELLHIKPYIFMNLKTKTDVWHFPIDDSDKKHIGDEENSAESTPDSQVDPRPTIIYTQGKSIEVFYETLERKASLTGWYTTENSSSRKKCKRVNTI